MRVAIYCSPTDKLGPPGPETVSLSGHLAAALSSCGIVAIPLPPETQVADIGNPQAAAETLRLLFQDKPPQIWVTVGSSTDNPDLVGPSVCSVLDIPYLVFVFDSGLVCSSQPLRQTEATLVGTLAQADAVVTSSGRQFALLEERLPDPRRLTKVPPMLDATPYFDAARLRKMHRASIASHLQLDPSAWWLLVDGPTQITDAFESYRLVARALARLPALEWQLIVAGNESESSELENAIRALPSNRVRRWAPAVPGERVPLYVACDLFVWPAVGEIGMDGLLHAQAAGLPVITCDSPGVRDRVRDGTSGRIVAADNAEAIANIVAFLLRQPQFLATYRNEGRRLINEEHDLWVVGQALAGVIEQTIERR